ncbi:outer membrane protein transport protein [Photobacterium sanguinicancri]|uniref:Aromatic hydrocarbon degradation protein n=1 Tax=Photobacterium sanguinicancri TaxID=875932 RepID=A0ABX4FRH3_9GAMM|nr:outer membrane protein transport protein [Photobacterium sanguinicancri]OZS41423.1 aromatic hydrocarbon degradation protein [Photobacterium sanguinicancri]
MKKNNITIALAAALTFGVSTSATAAGFQLAEYSATGLGRAFAGEAAMADNAGAQFRNPAMLTYLKGTQVSTGAIYVDPNIDVKGNLHITKPVKASIPTEAEDIAGSAVIPNFYVSHQLNDQVFLGLAFSTNYGMETKLGGDFKATQYGNQAKVHSVEINPNIAYQINEQFSVGAGVRYVMGEGHFGAATGGQDLKYMEGEDNAWGWQLGTAWQINDDNRIGFNYRSAVDLKLEGEASGLVFDMMAQQKNGSYSGSMDLTLPATAELASFHQLTDQLAVHASFNWTDWSSFDKLEANIDKLGTQHIKDENWEDNYRFAVGSTYQLNQAVVLRTGVAYDTSAVNDDNRTQTIPETDRLWLSVGAGYQVTKAFTLDGGFTYIFAKDASMTETDDNLPGSSFTGETTGSVWLVGVQASYRF